MQHLSAASVLSSLSYTHVTFMCRSERRSQHHVAFSGFRLVDLAEPNSAFSFSRQTMSRIPCLTSTLWNIMIEWWRFSSVITQPAQLVFMFIPAFIAGIPAARPSRCLSGIPFACAYLCKDSHSTAFTAFLWNCTRSLSGSCIMN